jgi:hypothetical protein
MELQVILSRGEDFKHLPFDISTRTIKIKKIDFVKNKVELKLVADFDFNGGEDSRQVLILPHKKSYDLFENSDQQLGYVLKSLSVEAKFSENDDGQVILDFE